MSVPLPFDLARMYDVPAAVKRAGMLATLNALGDWHAQRCAPYRAARETLFPAGPAGTIEALPYLPVRLFKSLDLLSVPREAIVKTLVSSGTTGHTPSRIHLDRETSVRQGRVLTAIMTAFLGRQRLPMVVADSAALLRDRTRFNARAAALLGFSVLGRDHFHALDELLLLDTEGLDAWLAAHADQPVLLFGFTALVWQHLVQALRRQGRALRFPEGSWLLHGGGWKRLADQQVSHQEFKAAVRETLGITRVANYYGMVEQTGTIFMECEQGHLHSPVFADVVVRDARTLQPLGAGQPGVLQVLSALPLSYPGHSLLTEDLGVLHGEDDCACGRLGRYFSVLGRMPEAELRGCSDTRVLP
ncbi:acyl-protein synthetase [Caenimonas sedimenti]|uniref:Acyl-protein synthetase n=1 Tax=Caenimonas sedimenti TaxID=2596921 RepID=A0A562ZH35_9BURK|nr:acyl-protein synthetase [Caenimonas sedimenti]TWO67900.1 acyl-protein synthetase [Caenimonas sedimenti]